MKPADAAVLTAIVIVVLLLAAWYVRRRGGTRPGFTGGRPSGADGRGHAPAPPSQGPYNLGLYDHAYSYPVYLALAATSWDRDRRCAAYCQQLPCVVWCR